MSVESVTGAIAMPPQTDRPTVLLADDESGIRLVSRLGLEAAGYAVLEATDGASAVRISSEHSGPIHLLLTDVNLPDVDGVEVARRVRARHSDVRVVFMSGDAAGPTGLDFPTTFLPKPFSPVKLADRVRELLST
jgi:two-component system, cell cycle sensor histidine kinase and response regulator CckA